MPSPRIHTPSKSRFAPPSPSLPPRPAAVESNKVRVVVRVRPFLPSEIDDHPHRQPLSCVSFSKGDGSEEEHTLQISDSNTSRRGSYKLDFCYGEKDDISLIFAREVEPFLPSLFRGCNATVFAYGATGSGKTYTMQGLENRPGLMPLALTRILAMSQHGNSLVEVSYYEVYMDRCYDLLETGATEVSVMEGNDGKIQLRGLSQVPVKTLAEFREVFVNGCLRRRVGQTGLNDASSRSHGVLMVTVTSYENDRGLPVVGKLNLIDLAGNEDNRRTGNEGARLAESARINQSLFALSNVINALNSNEIRIPYRDSKLTRILQDSLGGTSRALMIACLNPKSYQEAAHTLSLAARSRQVMNQFSPRDKKEDLQMKVAMETKLQAWLEAKGKGLPGSPSPWKVKSLFYTPSRHHVNRLRQIDCNFVRDSCVTPKARRVLDPSLPNSGVQKGDMNDQEQNLPYAAVNKSELTQKLSQSTSIPLVDQRSSHCGELEKQLVDITRNAENYEKERVLEENCVGPGSEKENFCQELFTPHVKITSGSSSPPLSERLLSLRHAMREILHPISNDTLLEVTSIATDPSTNTMTKISSPKSLQMNSPTFMSPEKTPTCDLEGTGRGTPLEKFSKNSSGIKSTLMKEYLDFLNTASREELIQLKGIGEKRAAYILSLREFSPEPLKELEDLERIGISKKQALSLFKDTVRQIF